MLYMDRIKQFRQEKNISQAQMARTLGMTQQQYFKYEKGINEMPIRYLAMICETYSISADWILGLSEKQRL